MKVLGVDIAKDEIRWIGIAGTKAGGKLMLQNANSVPLPTSESTQIKNLLRLKVLVAARLSAGKFDRVAIVRADQSSSAIRTKCELIVEIACEEAQVRCELISTQTIHAAEQRKIKAATGSSLDVAFNGGNQITPRYLKRAATCAWCVL